MINLGILSAYSAYTGQTNSAYGLTRTTSAEDKQDSSDAKKSTDLASRDEINDQAIISDEAMSLLEADKKDSDEKASSENKSDSQEDSKFKGSEEDKFNKKLSPEEEQEVDKLKARDAEVKAHEQAHLAAASGINASAPTYDYQTGPDGQKYAVGGEVNISFSEGSDPEKNIANAEIMKAAAMAPSQPSGQDMMVAKKADKIIEEQKQKLAEQQAEEHGSMAKLNRNIVGE